MKAQFKYLPYIMLSLQISHLSILTIRLSHRPNSSSSIILLTKKANKNYGIAVIYHTRKFRCSCISPNINCHSILHTINLLQFNYHTCQLCDVQLSHLVLFPIHLSHLQVYSIRLSHRRCTIHSNITPTIMCFQFSHPAFNSYLYVTLNILAVQISHL